MNPNLKHISFADRTAHNVNNDEFKKNILDKIYNRYGLKIMTRHFDTFQEKYIDNLNDNPHLICVRSNGNPYFMFLTKINFINFTIFIDKKIQQGYFFPRMILVNYHFSDTLFTDTIFEGEMVKTSENHDLNKKWMFIINDAVVVGGQHLQNLNLVKRINIIYQILQNDFSESDTDIACIRVKKFFNYEQLQDLMNFHIPNLNYTARGIYFKPLFLRFRDILFNFDPTLIQKVDRRKIGNSDFLERDIIRTSDIIEKNSSNCDQNNEFEKNDENISNKIFLTKKTNIPDVYELHEHNNINICGNPSIPSLKISQMMREIFADKNMVDKVEISYSWNSKFSNWVPCLSKPQI